MKTNIKKLFKNAIVWIFIVFCILFVPQSFSLQSESYSKAIATSIGLDIEDNVWELSALIVVSTSSSTNSSNSNSVEIISGTGESISEALNGASFNLGKPIGLAHCDSIILSPEVLKTNIVSELDYLYRSNTLIKNAIILSSLDKAKDVLETAKNEKDISSIHLSDIVRFSEHYVFNTTANIESFYRSYYLPSSLSFLNVIKLTEQQQSDGGSSGGGESGASESQSGSSNKKIEVPLEMCVISNGSKIYNLNKYEMQAYDLLSPHTKVGYIYLHNVNTDKLTNANLTFYIRSKSISKSIKMEHGVPVIKYSGYIIVKIVEVQSENGNLEGISTLDTFVTDEIKDEIINQTRDYLNIVKTNSVENNVDVFEIRNYFLKHPSNKWDNYFNSLGDDKNVCANAQFDIDIKIKGKF